MYPKKYRLPRRLISLTIQKGVAKKNPYFVVKSKKNLESFSRFAITVSSKISPKAIERNTLKRKISDSTK